MSEKISEEKRTSLRKSWEVLFPYLLYYLACNAAYLILAFAYQATVQSFGGAYGQFMTAHAATVSGVMGGLCMLAGVLPLVPMFMRELRERGEAFDLAEGKEATGAGSLAAGAAAAAGSRENLRRKVRMSVTTVVLAPSASIGLNALLAFTGLADSSQTYREVADRQYGVAFAVGLILYGLISPLAEEVVFRGVIYNRLRRYYGKTAGIIASGLLFGVFHGNLVQGVYGACLGTMMAYLYEKSGDFRIPFLFHAAANLAVYITARFPRAQEILFTPAGCAVLLAVSAGCLSIVCRGGKKRG